MTDKISYALGLSIANNFLASGIKSVDADTFAEAMKDVFSGKQPQLSYEEAKELIDTFFTRIQNEEKELNLAAGKEYAEIMKHKSGVVTLPSGVQYEILEKGDGPKPKKTDTVDSSRERGKPATFPVSAVIPGWTEVLQLMPVGSKWRVVIPSHLAYGERGAGSLIKPNMTLVFEIELLGIEEHQ